MTRSRELEDALSAWSGPVVVLAEELGPDTPEECRAANESRYRSAKVAEATLPHTAGCECGWHPARPGCTLEDALEVLEELFRADPAALERLMEARVLFFGEGELGATDYGPAAGAALFADVGLPDSNLAPHKTLSVMGLLNAFFRQGDRVLAVGYDFDDGRPHIAGFGIVDKTSGRGDDGDLAGELVCVECGIVFGDDEEAAQEHRRRHGERR